MGLPWAWHVNDFAKMSLGQCVVHLELYPECPSPVNVTGMQSSGFSRTRLLLINPGTCQHLGIRLTVSEERAGSSALKSELTRRPGQVAPR